MVSSSSGWTVQQNEVRSNGINNAGLSGLSLNTGSGLIIQQNLFTGNGGPGIDTNSSTGSNTMTDNTVTNNGTGTGASLVDPGIRIFGSANSLTKNIISSNVGAGVLVTSGASTTVISQNSIFLNGTVGSVTHEIGIDLESASDNALLGTSPFVTLNDSGDVDTGGKIGRAHV